VTEMTIKNHKY